MAKRTPRSSRRRFMTQAGAALPALMAVAAGQSEASDPPTPPRSLKVVCVGAHPDDPESGCGGTLARYATAGHQVTAIYLTRGEAGIPGKSHDEAATIRTAQAQT